MTVDIDGPNAGDQMMQNPEPGVPRVHQQTAGQQTSANPEHALSMSVAGIDAFDRRQLDEIGTAEEKPYGAETGDAAGLNHAARTQTSDGQNSFLKSLGALSARDRIITLVTFAAGAAVVAYGMWSRRSKGTTALAEPRPGGPVSRRDASQVTGSRDAPLGYAGRR